jgi:hypothetical protein
VGLLWWFVVQQEEEEEKKNKIAKRPQDELKSKTSEITQFY